MAISVGAAAQKIPQTPLAKPQPQAGREGKEPLAKTDLAPAIKQAAQCAAGPAAQAATQVATQAVGALLNTTA